MAGQAGVVAKPTNEELLAAKEPRVKATPLQASQARAAGMRSEQFVSTNHGKPAIAATAKPGEFKGKGVVPARAAGKAAEVTAPAGNAAPETKEKRPVTGQPAPTIAGQRLEGRENAGEKPVTPEAAPNTPKAEEKRPAEKPVEKAVKPEAAPNAPKAEEKSAGRSKSGASPRLRRMRRKLEEKPVEKAVKPEAAPNAPKAEEKRPVEKPTKPEPAANPAKIEERRPAVEKPAKPEPLNGAQREIEHPPARLSENQPSPSASPKQGSAEGQDCRRVLSNSSGTDRSAFASPISAQRRIRLKRAQCTAISFWSAAGRSPPD